MWICATYETVSVMEPARSTMIELQSHSNAHIECASNAHSWTHGLTFVCSQDELHVFVVFCRVEKSSHMHHVRN